jgi:general secretion pathway protein F
MPAYAYEAIEASGKTTKGVVEADSAKLARTLLRQQQLTPLSVTAIEAGQAARGEALPFWRRPIGRTKAALSFADRVLWTRQLASLLGAGLPLERALKALVDEATRDTHVHLLAEIRSDVQAGQSLALSLSKHPGSFPHTYCAVIAAAEQTGQLAHVLEQLAQDLDEQQALRGKLLAAALYPAVVCGAALLIVVFLMTSVVPQVAQVYSQGTRTLPLLTQVMLAISGFLRQQGVLLLVMLALTFWGFGLALKRPQLRLAWDDFLLRLPVLGRLMRDYNAARFASTLSILNRAGVPILGALQAALETLSNRAMQADAAHALIQVREGAPLGLALAKGKRFPSLLLMFIRLGEQTGQLSTMLHRVAQQLSTEVQRRAMGLAGILEPLLILGMGVVVMVIVLAVLMPIMELNQWVR